MCNDYRLEHNQSRGGEFDLILWSFVDQLVEHGACTTRAVGLIPGTTEMYVCMTVNRLKCLFNGIYYDIYYIVI